MNRALMIGLDGATFALLKPLMDEGVMPFLKQFLASGVHGDLMSTQNPLTPPAWVSMVTGRSPDVHGIYDFLRPQPEGDMVFLKVNDARYIRCDTIWTICKNKGKRSTSLNFFGMAPPPPTDGYLISGFVPWKYLRSATWPPEFFDELKTVEGLEYRHLGMALSEEKKCVQGLPEDEFEGWIRLQGNRDGAWVDLLEYLMKKDPTELSAVVLDGPDKIQHLFWRYLDRTIFDAAPSSEFDARIRELCLAFYRDLDRRIERLVNLAGPQTNIIMTSDHGFGATDEVVYINEWLAANGYLSWTDQAVADDSRKLTLDKIKDHTVSIDWPATRAYSVTPSSNAIYVKRARHSGTGVSDAEYRAFCHELRDKLLSWRNPADGGQVIVDVHVNETKLAGGDVPDYAPELTLKLRDGGFVSIVRSGGEIVRPRLKVDGTHRPNGIFVANGPDIQGGAHIEPISILDITPLLLYLIDLPVPADMEGRVPVEILKPGSLERRPVRYGEASTGPAARTEPTGEVSDEEKEALIAQMKVLGYMD